MPKDDCCSSVAVLVVLKCDSANLESIYAVLTISGVLSDIKTRGSVDSSIYEENDRVLHVFIVFHSCVPSGSDKSTR